MKAIQVIIGGVIVVAIGVGIYAIIKAAHAGSSDADEEGGGAPENAPSVVTVQVGALKQMTLHNYVSGYGTVEAAPATGSEPAAGGALAAPSAGIVARVNAVVGQHVEKGAVLMEMGSDAVRQEVERQHQLYQQHNTSLKAVQDAEAQLALQQVVAPVSGTVTRLNAKVGQAVDATTIVAEVIDLQRLAVRAKISATDAPDLKIGDEVQVASQSPVTNSLSVISPAVDPNDGTVSIWAALPADSGLRPGQFVPLRIITAVHTNCLAAPAESVVTDESGKSVIALVNGDEAARTPVTTGLREGGWVEVSGTGLKDGASVVTVGAYGLPEKTKIRVLGSAAEETTTTNSTSAK